MGENRGEGETKTYTYVYDKEDIILEYVSRIDGSDEEDHNQHGKKHHGKHKKESDRQEIRRYIHGPGIDEPFAVEQKGKYYYYHADGLGSITILTDHRGRVVQEYEYDSFGNMKKRGNKVKQPYTFTGREWDEEIGLYYYRARYYDAEVGRFISFDPILHPMKGLPECNHIQNIYSSSFGSLFESTQTLNPYVYVGNNPVNWTDPLGLFTCKGKWNYWVAWSAFWCTCYWQCVPCEGTIIYSDPLTTTGKTVFNPLTSEYDCTCPEPGPEEKCDDDKCDIPSWRQG